MSTLQETWDRFESFRDAFRIATTWTPDQLAQITAADVVDWPEGSASLKESDLGPNAFRVLAFISFLRSALAEYETIESFIEDLRRIAHSDDQIDDERFEQLATSIPPLLPATPDDARQSIRRSVSTSISPIIIDVTGSVDLRAVPNQHGTSVKFVPLALIRMSFDEAVSGGADAIVFQATPRSLKVLEDEIGRLREIFELAESAVGDSIL